MPNQSDVHHRRSIRLRGYDYSHEGAYFVTICTHEKQPLLGEVVKGEMILNDHGQIVVECWLAIPDHFKEVELDEWVVMPNHIHGVILIAKNAPSTGAGDGGTPPTAGAQQVTTGAQHAAPLHRRSWSSAQIVPGSLSAIVRSFKSAVTRRLNASHHTPGERFWQRNYYEHIIRNEADLNRIRDYIASNPARWERDEYYLRRLRNSTPTSPPSPSSSRTQRRGVSGGPRC